MYTRYTIRTIGAVLVGLGLVSCSKNPIPPNAHVQELGVLTFKANTPKQLPVYGDPSLYCVWGRPEQLAKKVELFATAKQWRDNTILVDLDVMPTPADYKRLNLKHGSFAADSGKRCLFRITDNEWISFTPKLETS